MVLCWQHQLNHHGKSACNQNNIYRSMAAEKQSRDDCVLLTASLFETTWENTIPCVVIILLKMVIFILCSWWAENQMKSPQLLWNLTASHIAIAGLVLHPHSTGSCLHIMVASLLHHHSTPATVANSVLITPNIQMNSILQSTVRKLK